MVYKIVKEWEASDRDAQEITIYKYNYNHDEMVRYTREGEEHELTIWTLSNITCKTTSIVEAI